MKTTIAATDFASAGGWYSYNDSVGDVNMEHFSIARDLGPNGMLTYIKAARQCGGNFKLQSPMDYPPDWMLYDVKSKQDVQPKYYQALANYYLKYLKAYQENGVFIDYLSTFNEPMGYCKINFVEIATLIKNNVGPLFASSGIKTKIMACEVVSRNQLDDVGKNIMDDPDVAKYVSAVGYHGYESFFGGAKYETVSNFRAKYPGTPLWMTELCYAFKWHSQIPDLGFSDGENWGKVIYNDLDNGASAWIYWNMILDQNGGPWLVSTVHGDPDPNAQQAIVHINSSTGAVIYTGLYYYLSHFSKYVRPGYIKIDSKPARSNEIYTIAFKSSDGKNTVTNIMNTSGSDKTVNIKYKGRYVTLSLPANSITTLSWTN